MNKSELTNIMIKITEDRDEMAFSDLFDFIAPKINTYFLQNGLTSDNAEELTQEVMSVIWTKSDRYDESKSAVSTWIYTIARNKKIDFYRKNLKIKINEDDIREFIYDERQQDTLTQNDIKDQVDKINKELNINQKKIIKMNFFESKSHKKIAQELEIPLGTVKSRIRHILTKLQRIL
tara:strand:+ start:2028 stop:2561 length:534 start_codon:yes stop_codon:yes gene_type:complete